MRFNIHGGHNPDGKIRCGAVGIIKESAEDRKVTKELIKLLESHGHTCYNCTVDNGTSARDVLHKIVAKCNQHNVDVDVSIHFNRSNGEGYGTEVLYKTSNGSKWATKVLNSIVKNTGLRDRGIKKRDNLYFLNNTKNVAILVECCFCDNKNDCKIYNYKDMAMAIAEGLTGESFRSAEKPKEPVKKNIDTAIVFANDIDEIACQILHWELKEAYLMPLEAMSKYNIKKIIAVGSSATDLPHADIVLRGEDRFETVKEVSKEIDRLRKDK